MQFEVLATVWSKGPTQIHSWKMDHFVDEYALGPFEIVDTYHSYHGHPGDHHLAISLCDACDRSPLVIDTGIYFYAHSMTLRRDSTSGREVIAEQYSGPTLTFAAAIEQVRPPIWRSAQRYAWEWVFWGCFAGIGALWYAARRSLAG